MHKIFISGSMRIKNIDKKVIERINNIIDSKYEVIVGDADGVDSSIQSYLASKDVKSVTVYCTGSQPRNNIGRWVLKQIKTDKKPGTRDYFTAKDISMSEDCDYGLMIWDSKSTGTLSNVLELLTQNKASLVFVNKLKKFYEISNISAFEKLITLMSESAFIKADKKINLTTKIKKIKHKQLNLFEDAQPNKSLNPTREHARFPDADSHT
jgi:hypothetical protein